MNETEDSKFLHHKLGEIEQVRFFVIRDGRKIIVADTWKTDENNSDGVSSGLCYPKQFPDSEIHVEVAILHGLWVRLW
jgi:phage tail tube protein FII